MPIHFVCPFGHKLVVPDHRAGKKGRCPTCEQRVLIPVPTPVPAGRDGAPLNAGPGELVQLDPTDADELGFDENVEFAEVVAAAGGTTRKKKSKAEISAQEQLAEPVDEPIVPKDSAYDPSLFENLPDEPGRPGW